MKTNPFVAAFAFLLRFVPYVRNLSMVQKHGTLDGALLLFDKAAVNLREFADKAEKEADEIALNISVLERAQADKLAELARASRVARRIRGLLD